MSIPQRSIERSPKPRKLQTPAGKNLRAFFLRFIAAQLFHMIRPAEDNDSGQHYGCACPSAFSFALMVNRDTTVTIRVMAHAIPEEKSLIQKA